jgi:hypothetical protein
MVGKNTPFGKSVPTADNPARSRANPGDWFGFSLYYRHLFAGIRIVKRNSMDTQNVRTCFTITYTDEQFNRAKAYVDDMKRHPNRVYWRGKEGKTDQELIIEQIVHRILSGFYNDDPLNASRHIIRMDSMNMT